MTSRRASTKSSTTHERTGSDAAVRRHRRVFRASRRGRRPPRDSYALLERIRTGDLAYRPLYTTQSILSELATLCLYKLGHETAVRTLTRIRESESFTVVPVGRSALEAAADQFAAYDDQTIPFVDHTTAIIATERDVDHVFAFDGDFRTLGFTVVPEDVGVP